MIIIKRIIALLLLFVLLFSLSGCKVGFYSDEIIIEEGLKEVRLSVYGIDTLNPLLTKSQSASELLSLIYSPLYTFNEKLEPQPCLAEKITRLPDGISAKITLKPNIYWHSGVPFTAEDVVYTINEIKNSDSVYKESLKAISSAYINEFGELIIELKWQVMNLEGLLSFPVIRNGSADEIAANPDGTGVYKLEEKSASEFLLKHTDKDDAAMPTVRVSVMRTSTACLNAFESGELDLITSAVLNLDETTPAGEIMKYLYPGNNLTFLGFNISRERYQTPYLRLAVSNMIDRKELVDKGLFGMGVATELPINPECSLYTETDMLEYDIEGSIIAAGYTKEGNRYLSPDGEILSIEILVCEENARKIDVANLISAKLNSEGISATVITADYDTYIRRIKAKDYDAFIGEVKMPYNLDPGFLTESGNYFGYANPELDEVISAMRESSNFDELKEHIADYERIFKNDQPFVPLFYRCEGVIYKKNVSGISEPNFYNSLRGLENIYFTGSVKR